MDSCVGGSFPGGCAQANSISSPTCTGRLRGDDVRGDPEALPSGVCAKRPRQVPLPLPERRGEASWHHYWRGGAGGRRAVPACDRRNRSTLCLCLSPTKTWCSGWSPCWWSWSGRKMFWSSATRPSCAVSWPTSWTRQQVARRGGAGHKEPGLTLRLCPPQENCLTSSVLCIRSWSWPPWLMVSRSGLASNVCPSHFPLFLSFILSFTQVVKWSPSI